MTDVFVLLLMMMMMMMIRCGSTAVVTPLRNKPSLVPEDEHTTLNVTLVVGDGVGRCNDCRCANANSTLLPWQIASPVGWNVTKATFVVNGVLNASSVGVWLNGERVGSASRSGYRSQCSCGANGTVEFDRSQALSVADAALSYRYSGDNVLELRAANASACAVSVVATVTFANYGPYVDQVLPNDGDVRGGTEIVVLGANLRPGDRPSCRFGTQLVDAHPMANAPVNAGLRCRAPPMANNESQVVFNIVVATDNNAWPYPPSPDLAYYYYDEPTISSLAVSSRKKRNASFLIQPFCTNFHPLALLSSRGAFVLFFNDSRTLVLLIK
jgi:hypothetical protein